MPICRCVSGVVVEDGSAVPQAGLRVRLVTGKGRGSAVLAETTTDEAGRFSIDVSGLSADDTSGVYELRVFDGVTEMETRGDVRWSVATEAKDLVVCVTWPEACAAPQEAPPQEIAGQIDTSAIHGVVRHVDGTALEGLEVSIWEVGFSGETLLVGPVQTLTEGWFSIGSVTTPPNRDLYVKVFEPGSPSRLVGRSKVTYGYAGGALRFTVTVCDEALRGASEFTRLTLDLSKVIFPGAPSHPDPGLPGALVGMDVRQVAWAAGRLSWSLDRVAERVLAERLDQELSAPGSVVGAEPIYGLLREGFPRTGKEILARPPSVVAAALNRARTGNVIGLDVVVQDVLDALVAAVARALDDGGDDALGEILRTSQVLSQPQALTDAEITEFCELYAGFDGTDEAFWAQVTDPSGLGWSTARADEAKRLVRLGALGLGHAPTVLAILKVLGTARADVVGGWSAATWDGIAGTPSVGPDAVSPLPDGLDGATEAEQRATLSTLLREHAALAFPAGALRAALSGSVGTALGVAGVFADPANATVDIRTARIYSGTPDVPSHTEADVEPLRTAQRLVRIAPVLDAEAALSRLVDLEVKSARDVAARGKTRFVERYAGGDPALEEEARGIVARARSQAAMAGAFFLSSHPALGRARLGFVPDKDVTVTDAEIPGWSELFATPTGTRCAWCQSIHGPSAYLVDLLSWLSSRTTPSGSSSAWSSALDALLDRRPDLADLPLSCENAERVLPTIDLTLEILEGVVSGVGIGSAHSSEAESAELLAAPQYTIEAAYAAGKLGDHTRSFTAPFHQPLAVARPFLAHLGIDRTDLMRAFADSAGISADDIAKEELRLSLEGAAAITASGAEQDYWSFTIPPVAADDVTVKVFRRAAEVDHQQILDLLHTRLANPASGVDELVVRMETGGDPYDVSSYAIQRVDTIAPTWTAPTTDQFTAMRKVLRLWRATGWTLLDLDRVCAALGEGDPATWDDDTLLAIGEVHRLCRMTELSPVELSGWFGSASSVHGVLDTYQDRDTREHPSPSLYDRTYLDPSVFPLSEQDDTAFPFALNAARDEIQSFDTGDPADVLPLRDQLDKLHAVLQVDEAEVEDLIDALEAAGAIEQVDPGTGAVAALNLRNLGLLYRWCSLAAVIGVEPTDLVRLAELWDLAPSTSDAGLFADPSTAIDFIEDTRDLLGAGWTVEELDYVVRHERPERVAPTDDWIRGVLGRLRDTARGFADDLSNDDRIDALARQLAEELGVARATMDALHGSMFLGAASDGTTDTLFFAGDTVVDVTAASPALVADAQITLSADVSSDAGTIAAGTVITVPTGTVLGGADLQAEVTAGTTCTAPTDGQLDGFEPTLPADTAVTVPSGAAVTWESGSGSLTDIASGTLLADTAVTIAAIDDPDDIVSTSLLSRFLRSDFTAETETDESDPWSDIQRDDATWREDYAVVDALHKATLLQARLGADEDERAAWVARASDWSLLDPAFLTGRSTALRLPTSGASAAFSRLHNTIDLFRQRARLPGSTPSFADVIAEPTASNLAERTGWDEGALDTLVGAGIGSVSDLDHVLDRMDFVRRAGAAPEVVEGWAAPGSLAAFTSTESREIVAAARSRHPDADTWSRVARPLRDPVRKAQRDALVSYLIAEDSFAGGDLEDADDLYEYYLIDVSMNPEMLTSRVVQATLAVQLFVHRTLFGLELDDTDTDLGEWFNDEDRAEWEWMRTYRVWEAARKVFLYPENWIEPELRDDKTPFFVSLERELAQGDVTDDRVEQVTLDYLDRLRNVASLKILACHVEQESDADGTIDRFHVFARTHGEPATYWYRRRQDASTWTPWEEIKAGVAGEHLVPVVYSRRLMLFWAEFTEMQSESEDADPASWWEIRLAMSEYRDGKWSPKRLSGEALSLSYSWVDDVGLEKAGKSAYGFVSEIGADGTLTIRCVGARSAGAIAWQSVFYELGSFSLNTCTMELSVSRNATETPASRVALDPTRWVAPGYSNLLYDDNLEFMDDLDVYLGEVDEEGSLAGSASPVDVLDQIEDARIVVPGQYNDFVSQSPFFVSVGERTYFVEPQVDADEDLEDTTTSVAPSISGLSSFRAGTRAATDTKQATAPITEEDALALTVYLDRDAVRSTDAAVELIQSVDAALIETAPWATVTGQLGSYRFSSFYHPYVCRFIEEVRREGVFGLIDPDPDGTAGDLFRQALAGDADDFETRYQPTDAVTLPYPVEEIDFSLEGAYSPYNWELFFHLPFYLANRLADAGRYQESIDWFHAMFDPRTRTGVEGTDPVENGTWWKVKPFLEPASQPVTDWIAFTGAGGDEDAQASFEAQVAAWRDEPFNPHALARLRPGTYQRALVMRYVDTLIAWGDSLFTRDTLESINEATQLYVFARQVLGDRPELLGDAERPDPKTWDDLKDSLDDFSNPLVALENAAFSARGLGHSTRHASRGGAAVLGGLGLSTYFCVPFNAKLLSYWDTIDDRLFKIRNGMNIEGVVRSLPLFQPPIDPAMLVRAAAAGIDIGSALSDAATVGHYRFNVMIGRAKALAGSVQALGQALLSALEKRDAEALAMLRQTHEQALLDAVKGVRERQVEEAEESLAALRKSRKTVQARRDYYAGLIDKGWLPKEEQASELTDTALTLDQVAAGISGINAVLSLLPDVALGIAWHARTGGANVSNSLSAATSALAASSGALKTQAGRLTTTASYKRRAQEWKNQKTLAKKELAAIDKQIAAAEIRVEVSKRELKNHELQIRHSEEVAAWMERKFTNAELYDWMVGQLATLLFQSWQLAYATAKKAEACYNHELGRDDSFVQAVHWDGTKKGLLAGERLQLDLARMDAAYLDHDARELELVKQVSLSRLDPLALVRLRQEGECWFELPEVLFDLDCPGHVNRRLVSVALTASCVGGPHGQVNLRLTLHGSKLRPTASDDLEAETCTYPSIVTSTAAEDGGVFGREDGRYQPFERLGAVSSWHLAFANQEYPQLDWDSVSDVTLHLRYTAVDGGESWRASRLAEIPGELDALKGGFIDLGTSKTSDKAVVALSAKRDAPDAWAQAQEDEATSITLSLADRLPYFAVGRNVTVDRVHVVVMDVAPSAGSVSFDGGGTSEAISSFAAWPSGSSEAALGSTSDGLGESWPDELLVSTTLASGSLADADDLLVVLEFSVS